MKAILRWFPFGDDSVKLQHIRQVPGITGVASCLSDVAPGEVWPLPRLQALKAEVNAAGLALEVIESVNIHEDIKQGLPGRDRYIDSFIQTLHHLQAIGIKCLCYNFMPVLDWARSELAAQLPDGSYAMRYVHEEVLGMNPASMADVMRSKARGYSLPGWEPERLHIMQRDIACYQRISQAQYWQHIQYFLDAVIPVAEQLDIRMAIHPDDPPWPLYGLPKVINSAENIRKFLSLHSSPYNGLTLCTGSLGADRHNDIPRIIREFSPMGRIHFAHIRNIRRTGPRDFDECAHLSSEGELDMYAILKAFYDTGFTGYMRPDHGRMIWGEQARPGYGLYDRALGLAYLLGIWEALGKAAG